MNTVIRPRSVAALAALGVLTVSGVASAGAAGRDPATVPDTTEATSDTAAASGTAAGGGEPVSIAFFASSSQNGYNQAVYDGIEQAAEEAGNVETEIFDGEFNAEIQFNQIEDVVASGRFDGYVIVPNDPVGIAPAAEQALAAGPTATALFPIGPDLDSLEPQLDGHDHRRRLGVGVGRGGRRRGRHVLRVDRSVPRRDPHRPVAVPVRQPPAGDVRVGAR